MRDLLRSKRRQRFFSLLLVLVSLGVLRWFFANPPGTHVEEASAALPPVLFEPIKIEGVLEQGQTLTELFQHAAVHGRDLHGVVQACDGVQDLRRLKAGHKFRLLKDKEDRLLEFRCEIDDEWYLVVSRAQETFQAHREPVPYTVRPVVLTGRIATHLVGALAETSKPESLAMELSEIFSWDIDFATDLRQGDAFEVLVEELRSEDGKIRYGRVLAAEIINAGESYRAYLFESEDGESEYYDDAGRPLRRGFLRSPLRYKYISSRFSQSRLHPILKIRRPHLGVDYAAPTGTPVSAAGDGTVVFAGRKGGFGKYVEIRHPGGYVTAYGHLSRFGKGVRRGAKVQQGEIIAYVGSTGLSSGPHLDYRVKRSGQFIDPLKLKEIRKPPLKGDEESRFKRQYARLELLRAGAFLMVLNNSGTTHSSAN